MIAYFLCGKASCFFLCLSVTLVASYLVKALLMALVFLARKSFGWYFLPLYRSLTACLCCSLMIVNTRAMSFLTVLILGRDGLESFWTLSSANSFFRSRSWDSSSSLDLVLSSYVLTPAYYYYYHQIKRKTKSSWNPRQLDKKKGKEEGEGEHFHGSLDPSSPPLRLSYCSSFV